MKSSSAATKSEYLTDLQIRATMKKLLPSHQIVHSYSPTHHILKITLKDLLIAPIENWMYNRPPDMVRAADIAQYMTMFKKPMDSMFFFAYNTRHNRFDVIDGIHRFKALKMMYTVQAESKTEDTVEEDLLSGFIESTTLPYEVILINVRFNESDGNIIDLFKSLNKSCPVPELYLRDSAKDKKEAIEALVAKWMEGGYKPHFSPSKDPARPNTSRDRMIDALDLIWDKYELTYETAAKLEELLEAANAAVKELIEEPAGRKQLSILPHQLKMVEKCEMTGLYLFLKRGWENEL
jgi:hypothetical protein